MRNVIFTIFFTSFLVHAAPTLSEQQHPISLSQYKEEQQKITEQLGALKKSAVVAPQQPAVVAAPPQKDALEQQHMILLKTTLEEVMGATSASQVLAFLSKDPQRLRICLTLAKTQGPKLKSILANPAFVETLLKNPTALAASSRPYQRPILQTMIAAMSSLKKYMSPQEWSRVMHQFIGSIFIKFWSSAWELVRDGIVAVVGAEKIYEVTPQGEIKKDPQNNKVPRLIPQYSVNDEGEAVKTMIPVKWYNTLEDPQSLLGQLLLCGIDRSVLSTMQSLDRLLLRPVASSLLNIPRWKLSHLHYRLAMTELKSPTSPFITPRKLAGYIEKSPNKLMLVNSGLPFSLRSIFAVRDISTRERMLQVAIAKHLWSLYAPIWAEIQSSVKVQIREGDDGMGAASGSTAGTIAGHTPKALFQNAGLGNLADATSESGSNRAVKSARNIGQQLAYEAKEIARDTLQAKLEDGPLAMPLMYVNLALNIPQAVFTLDSQEAPAEDLVVNDKNGNPVDAPSILKAIDICEALARYERRQNAETLQDYTKPTARSLTLQHAHDPRPSTYRIEIAPATLARLLEAQEKGLKRYLPFMNDIVSDSYEDYIVKLLMPRLIITFTPALLRERLGIRTYADAAATMKIFQRHFNITYNALLTLSQMVAMVKKFENSTTFAGHYVEIGDVIDNFLRSCSQLIRSVELTGRDPWMKRIGEQLNLGDKQPFKSVRSRTTLFSPLIATRDAFTIPQRAKVETAQSKSRYMNPLLVNSTDEIYEYLNAPTADIGNMEQRLFRSDNAALAFALRRQKENKNLTEYDGKAPLSANALMDTIRSWAKGTLNIHEILKTSPDETPTAPAAPAVGAPATDLPAASAAPAPARIKQVTDRALTIMLHTFGLLSLNTGEKQNDFFTADSQRGTVKTDADLTADLTAFKKDINSSAVQVLRHVQQGLGALHTLYNSYGLREITLAIDSHYYATGKRLQDIPVKMVAKIAFKEGTAHLVGRGADWLLKKGLEPVMSGLNRLQENGLMAGPVFDQMIKQNLNMFIGGGGGAAGKTNAYHAARGLVRNFFDYGTAAFSPASMQVSVLGKFLPAQMGGATGGVAEHNELRNHARMIKKSGKAPTAEIALRLRRAGIDPNNIPKSFYADEDDEESDEDFADDATENDPLETMSPALKKVFTEAQTITQTKGAAAARAYILEQLDSLSPEDRAILKQFGISK